MARPKSKTELLEACDATFTKLQKLLTDMTPEQLEGQFHFDDRDRCVRDVLVHLHEWHLMLLRWVESNLSGNEAPFLPQGYTWTTYFAMNVEIQQRAQGISLAESQANLERSHSQVVAMIENHTDEELFVKKRYSWTGSTSLGAYCISNTSSHYEWAMKKLRKHLRTSR